MNSGRDGQLSKRSARAEEMRGWVVDVVEDQDGDWWALVALTGTYEGIEDGPYPTATAALDAGHKVAYDYWVEVVE